MKADPWITEKTTSLLDVGCNVGAWLADCAGRFPDLTLAGVDMNEPALEKARLRVPRANIQFAAADRLPFTEAAFDAVTCIEVIEHIPEQRRAAALQEMRRVLKPGGLLVVTTPHHGWFGWLDSNNMRFRLSWLYNKLVGGGLRDRAYLEKNEQVEWHHHFTRQELLAVIGPGWTQVAMVRGGMFLYPVMDWISWPFYRLQKSAHPIRRLFERVAGWDYSIDYGPASYGIMLVLRKDS